MTPGGDRPNWRAGDGRRHRGGNTASPALFAFLRALVILMFGILALQLVNMQVIKGDEYKERSAINALREAPLIPARGLIYDRSMRPLVQNSARFTATIVPGDLPERGEAGVYRLIAGALQMPVAEIERLVKEGTEEQGEFNPAIIKRDVPRDDALALIELEPHAPGLKVMVEPIRQYLPGSLLSHVLGYVGPLSAEEYADLGSDGYLFQDFIGKSGVEYTYEATLRGKLGKKLIEVDASGREIETIDARRAIDGSNLVLSIDLELQKVVANALQEYAGNSESAAAAVMDVRTGEILAMVSLPAFDNNVFSGTISSDELAALVESPGKPLVNHDLSEQYAPGSTFKAIVGAAALQEGVATPSTVITSTGQITVENEFNPNVVYPYRDWAALGPLDFYQGLAMSSNIYYYYLAGGRPNEGFAGLGEERVARYARAFGLGEPTGIDLPGESAGLVPDAEWKLTTVGEPWTLGDSYDFGIGKGYVAATPIQMLVAASGIANGGRLLTPHVLKEVRDSHGNLLESLAPEVRRNLPVEDAHLKVVRDAMRRSVTEGVTKRAAVSNVSVAGKTGTAEFGPRLPNGKYETHGWFVGFAPYEDPKIAVVVFLQQGSGGNDASPTAARIIDSYFNGPRLAARPEGNGQ